MIERYTTKQMAYIWSQENKFYNWVKVELAVCKAQEELNRIPKGITTKIVEKLLPYFDPKYQKDLIETLELPLKVVEKKYKFDIKKIEEIEKITNHDVIAFLTYLEEILGDISKYIHLGMTSSDLVDTAFALQIKESLNIIEDKINQVLEILKNLSLKYKLTLCIGRTHGIHAEPMSFGLKFLLYYNEFKRHLERLKEGKKRFYAGKISGAVGTFAHLPPEVEERTCKILKIPYEEVSNQVVQRDRHAEVLNFLALVAASIEKVATEIRHLQRSEVREAEEPFREGQKGSSAMPHKKNPIICERLCGLSRYIRSNTIVGYENIPLWHERDISHSSTERIIFPDSFIALDYMFEKFLNILRDLKVYKPNLERNLNLLEGLVFSQRVLLALIEKGKLKRQDAYKIVQENALKVWEIINSSRYKKYENEDLLFYKFLKEDERVKNILSEDELKKLFEINYCLRHIEDIYKRVLTK